MTKPKLPVKPKKEKPPKKEKTKEVLSLPNDVKMIDDKYVVIFDD